MKNIKIILLLIIFGGISITTVNATYCLQEQANESGNCKGIFATGNYSFSNLFNDADYNSAFSPTGNAIFNFSINYTKPLTTKNSSLWQIKVGLSSDVTDHTNLSIPLSCFSQTPLQFMINVTQNFIRRQSQWNCYNGNNFIIIYDTNNTGELGWGNRLFEEAMFWNMSNPQVNNVSITPTQLIAGNNPKGHANYSDGDTSGGNQTYWYVNKTIINEANNSFTLLGGNVTENSNITFSTRFNDTYDWSDWVNSSTITVGDTIAPAITGQAINGNSFTTEQRVNITANCTDAVGTINYVRVEWNRTGAYANDTMTLLNTNQYSYSTLFAVGNYNATNIYCADGSGNIARDLSNFTFTVASPAGGGSTSSGGGGGGSAKTIIIREGIPLLSFGGLTLIDFNVLTTPSKKVKIVRFKNVGNVTFENAKASIEGNANKFINPFVCNLNLQDCINESISIKAGESMLLSLNGSFNEELGEGSNGVIRIQEIKEKGNTHELNLLISRPPLYSIAVRPLANIMGIPELLAFVIVYLGTALLIIGGIGFATIL